MMIDQRDQSSFDLAASRANRSAFNRSRFLSTALCIDQASLRGLQVAPSGKAN
jgi:hypothetical protein